MQLLRLHRIGLPNLQDVQGYEKVWWPSETEKEMSSEEVSEGGDISCSPKGNKEEEDTNKRDIKEAAGNTLIFDYISKKEG